MSADEKARILVVEDDEDCRFLLNQYLSRSGYCVLVAREGEEAKQVLSNEFPQPDPPMMMKTSPRLMVKFKSFWIRKSP